MRIAFVYSEFENLGIEYLSAVLKKNGHGVKLFFDPRLFDNAFVKNRYLDNIFNYKKKVIRDILSYNPDFVMFSVLTDNYQWCRELAKQIKLIKKEIIVVFGGMHPTSAPEIVSQDKFVDYVFEGESETSILKILSKKIPNRRQKDDILVNLDKLPFPDKKLFYDLKIFNGSYMTSGSRGCYYNCSYCCNSFLKKKYGKKTFRQRNVKNLIEELKSAKQKHSIKSVVFNDEIFTLNKDWIRQFSQLYSKHVNLPFFCWSHPNHIDEEIIVLLKQANCKELVIGVQTTNINLRKNILKRYESNNSIINAINLTKKHGIKCIVESMYDLPLQTEQDIINDIKFYNELRPDLVLFFSLNYYPGTEIINIAKKHKIFPPGGYIPFTLNKGTSHSDIIKILPLMYILPKSLFKFILDKKFYRIFPLQNTYILNSMVSKFCSILKRKKNINYGVNSIFRQYFSYMNPLK